MKCEGKEPSVSDKLPIDVIGVIRMSITYWLGERLYRCISYAYSVYSQLIALRGMFPDTFQVSPVSPLLKKPTLNRDDMKNFPLVSNLSFLSKILEKVMANRLNSHINSSLTSNDYQSEYRKFH